MRLRCRILAMAGAALVLAACASPTPYQPRTNGNGYAEQLLEGDRYRVSFTGNSVTSRDTVENYLLYRAAEIALREGKDYFILVGRDTEIYTSGDGGPTYGGMVGRGWGPHGWRSTFTGLSVGTGTYRTNYSAQADIILHAGPRPSDDPRAYDARALVENLGPTIVRPGT